MSNAAKFYVYEANILNTPFMGIDIDFILAQSGRGRVGYILCTSTWADAYNMDQKKIMGVSNVDNPVDALLKKLNETPHF